jgi:hypothetical protein
MIPVGAWAELEPLELIETIALCGVARCLLSSGTFQSNKEFALSKGFSILTSSGDFDVK